MERADSVRFLIGGEHRALIITPLQQAGGGGVMEAEEKGSKTQLFV